MVIIGVINIVYAPLCCFLQNPPAKEEKLVRHSESVSSWAPLTLHFEFISSLLAISLFCSISVLPNTLLLPFYPFLSLLSLSNHAPYYLDLK